MEGPTLTIPIRHHHRIAIDSAPLIYLLLDDPRRAGAVEDLLAASAMGAIQIFTSTVNEAEVLVRPLRSGDKRALEAAATMFAAPRMLTIVDVTREVAVAAAAIRAQHGLELPDAVVAGSARTAGCTLLVGNDAVFRRLDDIEYLHLDDHL